MSTLNIPGLIAGKKTLAEKHLTDAELQKERLRFAEMQTYKSKQDKLKAMTSVVNNNGIPDSITSTYHMTTQEIVDKFGVQTGDYVFPYQQPYQQPLELDNYKKFFPNPYPSTPKTYGPSPSRTGINNQDWEKELMSYLKPKKSAFEEILDVLFTTAEKEQFLIDIGYMLNWNNTDGSHDITRKLASGEIKTITNSLNDLFLKEITVKFKNLLLAKATLKLKL